MQGFPGNDSFCYVGIALSECTWEDLKHKLHILKNALHILPIKAHRDCVLRHAQDLTDSHASTLKRQGGSRRPVWSTDSDTGCDMDVVYPAACHCCDLLRVGLLMLLALGWVQDSA